MTFAIQRKFTVNGKEYGSLDQVPPEFRAAIEKALESGATASSTTVTVNGRTYASLDEVPAPLRTVVRGRTSLVVRYGNPPTNEAGDRTGLRPEPILSMKTVVLALGLAALLVWLARSVF